jgi:Copine/C2 domain
MLRARPLDESLTEILGKSTKKLTGSLSTASSTARSTLGVRRTTNLNTAPGTTATRNAKSTAATAADNEKATMRLPKADAVSLEHPGRQSISNMGRIGISETVKKAGKGTVKATQIVGKGVGVAGKGATKLGAKTARGTFTATKLVAKNTVRVGKGTVGAVTINLQDNAVVKGVAGLGGNVIQLADTGINRIARTLKRHDDVVAAAAWKTRATSVVTQMELVLECQNLRRKDAFAECDAFCVLWQVPNSYGSDGTIGKGDDSFSTLGGAGMMSLSSITSKNTTTTHGNKKRPRVNRLPSNTEKEVGRTEVVRGNSHPKFAHRFVIDYNFAEEQCFVLRVYDRDLEFCPDLKEHDFLGGTFFTMGDLIGIGKRELRRPLRPPTMVGGNTKSLLTIRSNEVTNSRSVLEFRFSAQGLREGDKGVIEKEDDSYFEIFKLNQEDQSYQAVYKSEVKKHDNTPTWAKTRLPLPLICDNDIATPLRINFFDWKRSEQAEPLGYVETSVKELVEGAQRGIPVMDVVREHKRLFRRDKVRKSGRLKVLKADLHTVPTMIEYVCGGCKIDLMVAVDCSVHNGDSSVEGGLHHRPAPMWLNDYQAAINKIGAIMEPYSKDSEFTIWGFGGDLRGESVPLFPMGGDDGVVHGATGMLDAYDMTFVENPLYMEPAETANIEPLIQSAMYRAIQKSEKEHCYSVLCILTAGHLGSELRETIDTLCTAAEDAPLSIVIIGVGENEAGFDTISKVVANGGKLRHSNGVPIARDIVGFATFHEFDGNAGKVVAESLRDLPEQLVEYFSSSGILPHPMLPQGELDASLTMIDGSRSSMGGSSRRSHMGGGSNRRRTVGRSDRRGSPGPERSRSPKIRTQERPR